MRDDQVQKIYDELDGLIIELDPDPASRGPAYLQDLISKTRGMLNKTSLLSSRVFREKHGLESELTALEAAYEVSADELLAEDNRVTRLPNIDDRRAMISLLLKEEKLKILDLKRQIKELGFVERAVRHRHKELDNTMSSIRMQKSLIDSEIRTGSFYGDENHVSRSSLQKIAVDDIDSDEIDRLMKESLAEVQVGGGTSTVEGPSAEEGALAIVETTLDQPKVEEEEDPDEEKSILKFLDGEDYSDILSSV